VVVTLDWSDLEGAECLVTIDVPQGLLRITFEETGQPPGAIRLVVEVVAALIREREHAESVSANVGYRISDFHRGSADRLEAIRQVLAGLF
jgi:hypothetical protein